VIRISDENPAVDALLLEMAFETERGVTIDQHFLVNRSVGRMTSDTALAHRLVFEHEWPSLGRVTLQTGVVPAQESKSSAPN
jgi:hypothetical protein